MPNGYSVGNLELDITALDKSATSLNNVISRLQSMLNLVSPISASLKTLRTDMSAISRLKFGSFDRLATGLNSLSRVNTQGLYTKLNSISRILTPLKELSAGMTSIGSVNTFANGLQKITKLDVAGFDTQIKALTASLRPFLQEITVATPALTAFATAMASVKGRRTINFKQFDQTGGGGKNLAKSLNLASALGKIYFIRNYTKQLGQSVAKIVQMGVDYAETLNLWQVAMRGNISTAEEFISKMNKAYGIAEETLMRYQATFRNMLSTLGGISPDTSYALSEYLTQMALDYASLYNTSIEKAMTVFQSVLSGQVRPIRSISGYDITETTIFELYQQLGGTKTMRQLTQTEKRLLRIYAVFQQMDRSGAIGDLSFTLNSTANTTRVLSETMKDLGTYLGLIADKYLAPLITKVTAFAITAKNIAKVFANPIIDQKKKELERYGLAWEDTASDINGASDAYDEFTGKLLGFDKFRSLSGGEQLGIGIDTALIDGLSQYEGILGNVVSEAQKLAEKWTSFFVDSKTGGITEKAKGLYAVLLAMGGLAIFKSLSKKDNAFYLAFASKETGDSIAKIAQSIGGVSKATQLLGGAIKFLTSPLGIILSIIGVMYLTNDRFRESVNNLFKTLMPLVTLLFDFVGQILEPIMPLLGGIINLLSYPLTFAVKLVTATIQTLLIPIGGLMFALEAVVKAVQSVIQVLADLASFNFANIGNNLSKIWGNWASSDFMSSALNNFAPSWGGVVSGYKNGGLVEDGLFTMNKGEVMGTFDDGTSIVANNQQIISGIKQGVYQAVSSALQANGSHDDRPIDIYIDGERVFQATKKNAKRHGLAFSKV